LSTNWIALTSFVLFLSTQVGVPVLPALAVELGAFALVGQPASADSIRCRLAVQKDTAGPGQAIGQQ